MENTNSFYVDIGSVTYAYKALNILAEKGINCKVGRNQNKASSEPCSYGVYVKGAAKENVLQILRNNMIGIR